MLDKRSCLMTELILYLGECALTAKLCVHILWLVALVRMCWRILMSWRDWSK